MVFCWGSSLFLFSDLNLGARASARDSLDLEISFASGSDGVWVPFWHLSQHLEGHLSVCPLQDSLLKLNDSNEMCLTLKSLLFGTKGIRRSYLPCAFCQKWFLYTIFVSYSGILLTWHHFSILFLTLVGTVCVLRLIACMGPWAFGKVHRPVRFLTLVPASWWATFSFTTARSPDGNKSECNYGFEISVVLLAWIEIRQLFTYCIPHDEQSFDPSHQ